MYKKMTKRRQAGNGKTGKTTKAKKTVLLKMVGLGTCDYRNYDDCFKWR
jgi:hypothetical protein